MYKQRFFWVAPMRTKGRSLPQAGVLSNHSWRSIHIHWFSCSDVYKPGQRFFPRHPCPLVSGFKCASQLNLHYTLTPPHLAIKKTSKLYKTWKPHPSHAWSLLMSSRAVTSFYLELLTVGMVFSQVWIKGFCICSPLALLCSAGHAAPWESLHANTGLQYLWAPRKRNQFHRAPESFNLKPSHYGRETCMSLPSHSPRIAI